jgi:sensor domain CHASE-containing protein
MPPRTEIQLHLFIIFLISLGVIWIRTATIQSTYQYVEREKKLGLVSQQVQSHRMRLAQMTSPRALQKLADHLELAPATQAQVYRWENSRP